jgi:amino acid adenylation domain-containing protein/non-ribosomal peptide synthase protein (TIGR01720 family)
MENDSKQLQIFARDYWENKMTRWHMDDFFIDFNAAAPGAPGSENDYGSVKSTVDPSTADRIKTIANHNEMAEYVIYLSFYAVLLYRYYRQPEVVISSGGIKNRGEKDAADALLFYKLTLKEDDSFKDTFRETGREVQETWKHSGYNYRDLETLFKNNHIDPHPLYRFGFFDNRINAASKAFEKVNLQFRLERVRKGCREIHIKFKKDVFKKEFVRAVASHYKNLLSHVNGGLDQTIETIEILSPSEKRQLLTGFNRSPADDSPGRDLVEVFREKAGMFPTNIALHHDGTHVTYKELNKRADRVAHAVREKGVTHDTVAALMMERSVEMIVGVLGILKAGGAYLPIDPEYPEDRIHYMLTDSGAKVLLTSRDNIPVGAVKQGGLAPLYLPIEDCSATVPEKQPATRNPQPATSHLSPESLAYVIYTSGSTGKPKGVMVEHRNVVRLVLNEMFSSKFGPGDVWTLFHSICFDVSVWELFGALLYGGKLIIVPTGIARTPRAMAELLERERVTILNQIPTVFINLAAEILETGKKRALVLRYIIFAGDALKPSLLAKWHETYPGTRLVNMYGITETTVHTTFKAIDKKEIDAGISTIGRALPAWQCYIADHRLRLLPIGIAGEIVVGGAGVSRGYLNRPGLTTGRFASIPQSNTFGKEERLYRSGDLARWLPEGNMEFLGRIDHQVKIRGFRVECGEIETRLLGLDTIKQAVVIAKHSSLLAYLVTVTGEDIDTEKTREYLNQYLPGYMIPEYFIRLDRFPLTASGKIDKKALPDPDSSYTVGKGFEAPQTNMEKALTNIWQTVLGVEKVGRHDNFFSLGGNSIKGIQVVNQVQEWFEETMHVSVLFEAPTVEKLAAVLDKQGIVPDIPGTRLDEPGIIKMRQAITPLPPLPMTAPKNPPALFILSPPRSGSTLLRVILAGHPGLFAPPELELLSFNTLQERKAALSGKFGYFKEGAVRAIMEIKRCSTGEAQAIMQAFEDQGLTSQAFYGVMQQWLGERMLVDKTPWYALDMETLRRAEAYFKAPRYIHLVRDPYAVIHSFEKANLDQIFRYDHDVSVRRLAELVWLICHQNIRAFLNDIPGDRQYTVKFEALVHRPETAAAGLCDFLDIEYKKEILDVYRDTGSKMLDGIHPESKMLGDINFLRHTHIESGVVDKWKRDYKDDFLGDTTRQLAKSLGYSYEEAPPASRYFKIEKVPESGYYELSNAQKRLWILAQFEDGSGAYNIPTAYIIEGKLDRDALETSYKDVVKRHEILRTTFIRVEGEPKQKVLPESAVEFIFEYLDLRDDPDREETSRQIARKETGDAFDLAKGPLSRARLIHLDEERYLFLLTLHHIITDAWSMGVLIYDIVRLYNAHRQGRENPLPPLPFQYKDYSAWQNRRKQSGEIKQQAAYWLKQFEGEIPILDLPTDFPRPPVQGFEGKSIDFKITTGTAAALKHLALTQGVTMNMLMLSLFNVFLAKITHQEDIIAGTPVTGRRHVDFEGIIGMFVNTLALRNEPAGKKPFQAFLRETRQKTLAAFENQEYQFEDLVDEVGAARDTSRNPLFDVMFVLQNLDIQPGAGTDPLVEPAGIRLTPYDYESQTSKFDLILFAFDSGKALFFRFEFSTRLFKEETIRRFIHYFKELITSVLHTPDLEIAQLEMIPGEEKTRLLQDFNDTGAAYPGYQTVHRLFEAQVERAGDRVAVQGMSNHQLSYSELNKRANRMAWLLREKGTGPGTAAALRMERSLDMIIAILGILKAGGAYLPIDTDYPTRRVRSILEESEAPVLLTTAALSRDISFTSPVPGRGGGVEPVVTAPRPQVTDFDTLPMPDRTLIDYDKYQAHIGIAMAKHTVSLQASRGCPYNCAYCCKIWPKNYVSRSAEHIFEEIRRCYDAGVKRFVFIDDVFNLDRKNSGRLLETIIKKNMDIQLFFPNGLRGDILTREFIDLLMEAGTVNIDLALESASPRVQRLIDKNLKLEIFKENVDYITRKYPHLLLEMELMIGFPTETEAEAQMTLDFLKGVKWVHFPNLNILKIFPNTDMYRLAKAHGVTEQAIAASVDLAYHQLPETLPFPGNVARRLQAELMQDYFLLKERLLQVLPLQMKVLTEEELVQKYDSYLPAEIKTFPGILETVGISRDLLPPDAGFVEANRMAAPGFTTRLTAPAAPGSGRVKANTHDVFRLLLLDISQVFSADTRDMLYDMVEEPLGLMALAAYIHETFGSRVRGKVAKSRVDFDSFDALRELIEDFKPHLIGIRTLSYYNAFFHQTVSAIRQWGVTIPIISGGPYASSDYKTMLRDLRVDLAVLGEGELTLADLVEKMMANNNKLPGEDVLDRVKGIAFIKEQDKIRLRQENGEIILVDQIRDRLDRYPGENPAHINRPEDLLYLISTSGSTGRPKTVMLEHRNLVNLLNFEFSATQMDFSGHVLQFASIGFDVSAQEMFSTFLKGGKLFIISKDLRADILQLFDFIAANGIGILFLPPAFLKMVFTHPPFASAFPRCVRHICAAGEPLIVPERFKKHLAAHHVFLHNHYGPAETHVVTTQTLDPAAPIPTRPGIGEPTANTGIYILDRYQNIQPIGVKGELIISGTNVGRGYLNNPELTMDRFNRSYGSYKSYKSGDLARWLPDGTIEFLGRADHQVKLRGFRVELEEIETQLLKQKGIKEAVVTAQRNERGDIYLCAYFVPGDGDAAVQRLREALEAVLPDYMVPAHFIPLEKIPLSTGGKLDRKALPAPGLEPGEGYTAPSGDIQETLAAIWAEVLEVEPGLLGIDSNFFNLGGHSLKATVLLARIHKTLDAKVTLTEMFKAPTIRHLSARIKAARSDRYRPIEPVEKKEYYPLSSAQKRLYILQQMERESTAYNMPQAIRFKEAPGIERLEQTFNRLIRRHESLRTSFQMVNNEPVQRIHDPAVFKIRRYDRTRYSSFSDASKDFVTPFDLSRAPLLRAGLIETRDNRHILIVDMHHIISDGVSHEILIDDFISFYRGARMPGLKLRYRDFSAWQNSGKQREKIKQQETYWLKAMEGEIPVPDMPLDYTRPEVQRFEGDTQHFEIDNETTAALKKVALAEGATLFMTLLAVYYIFLSKITRQEDIIIGTPTAGRRHADLQQIIGMFVNTLAVRSSVPGEETFKGFLSDVKKKALEAFENQDYPFEDLVEKVAVNRDAGRNPLFDVVFVYMDNLTHPPAAPVFPGETRENYLEPYEYETGISKFDLTLAGAESGDRLLFSWEYCTKLFKPGTIERFISCFKKIVSAVIENPGQAISRIEIIPGKEKREVLFEFNHPLAAYPGDKTIHELFEEQAARMGDKIALVSHGGIDETLVSITYRELSEKSGQLAWVLIEKGVKPGHIVGILVERSVEMIIGIMGILKAGGAYLPIDPEYPEERIHYMLSDSGAAVLLTNVPDAHSFNCQLSIVNYQLSMSTASPSPTHPTHLCYIIYTSGTTGKPKGAMIEHRNVVGLLFNDGCLFDFDRNDVWTMFHSYCFDFSVWEMYGALLYGGTLVIIPRMMVKDTRQFLEILKKEGVTVLNQTPAAFYNLAQLELQAPGKQLRLRYVIFGGDVLNPAKLNQWKEKYRETALINMFGITETTVHVTFKKLEDEDTRLNISNIGRPLPTLNTYVMDNGLNLVPIRTAGEICVEGEGVGRGYLNRPGLTQKKFGNSSYSPGQKYYLSGDLGRFLENGELEYLGRIDLQVKIRGYRVEPGEIENRLLKHGNIEDAVVIAGKSTANSGYLCAYVVPVKEPKPPLSELKEFLANDLPGYMIPTYFVFMEKIPLTANGKIDRRGLPVPVVETMEEYLAPGNETEETLTRVWQQVLTLERVGIRDNYFDLGGDSIKAIKLLSMINREFNINLRIVDLFTDETIEKLSARITREKGGYTDEALARAAKEIEAFKTRCLEKNEVWEDNIEDIYPMSDIEKGMVFHALKDPGQAVYHDQVVHQLTYPGFAPGRFKKALALMVDKHPVLRTGFNLTDFEEAVQVVRKKTHVDMEHQDISHMEPHGREEYIKVFIAEDRQNPIDPSSPPLWRMRTFSLDSDHVVVLWVCHHAIMDGWSDASFNTELNNIYLELETNPGYVPTKLKSSYKEFIVEQRVHRERNDLRDYWRNELQDYKRLEFPGSGGNREGSAAVKHVSLDLGIPLMERLKEMAPGYQTSLKHLCFSAYIYMLNMLSYENDIVTGLVTNNRPVCEDGEKILGCFLNTIPARIKISPPITWSGYTRMVDKKLKELARYDRLSLLEIVKLTGEEISDQNPLFDALFNFVDFFVYKEAHRAPGSLPGGVEDHQELCVTGQVRANTLFDFSIDATFGGFALSLSYSNVLLTDQMVWQLFHYFKEILNKFIEEPNAAVSKERLMGDEEKQKLLHDFNRTDVPYPGDKTIHQLVDEQVSKTPGCIALIGPIGPIGPISLSYRELAEKSGRLAQVLREKGVEPGTIVGIMAEPSVEMIIGILGILKAGGAYLPIDPNYPGERIEYMLRDSGAGILLTDLPEGHRFNGQWSMVNCQLSMSNGQWSMSNGQLSIVNGQWSMSTVSTSPTHPTHLCYIIYTSGSTGTPNGVMVEHRALVHLCSWHNRYYSVTSADRATKFAGFGFDASVWEIFPYLVVGASLYIIDDETKMEVERLNRYFEKNRITIAFLPTQMGEQFMEVDNRSLRKLLVGGDKLRRFKKRRYELYNNYGPTEYTVVTTAGRVDSVSKNIPIGSPIGNTRVYILDKHANLQPIHVPGELCISGAGLSRGYLNNLELTNSKFQIPNYKQIPNSKSKITNTYEETDNFSHHSSFFNHHSDLYRTGDLARWGADGVIQYLGRIDTQVKIRGYRVETGEVETRLLSHEDVKEAVVTVVDMAGDRQLCAYVVPVSPGSLETDRLREYLAEKLPGFMLPSYVVFLAELPLTPGGKIDRRALPKPGEVEAGGGGTPTPPRNPLEKQLVETWENVLGRDKVGIDDNFFTIGGDSIKAIQVISRMNKAGYRLDLKNLFSSPTISQLAPHLRKSERMGEQGPVSGPVPLTPIQHWFFESNIDDPHHFNQAVTLFSAEGFEEAALKAVFTKIQEHHDALRMTYRKTAAGDIIQTGHGPDYPLSLAVYDLRGKTGSRDAADAIEPKANEIQAGIDLEKGPLVKLALFRLPDGDRLLIVVHHLVIDGISWRILFEDIDTLLGQYKRGEPLSLPLKTDSFKHRAEELAEYANRKSFLEEKTHWTSLASQPVPVIKKDHDVDSNRLADTGRLAFRLSKEETRLLLTRVHEAFGTDTNDILLTSLALAFHAQFGLCRLPVALEGHGREDILTGTDISRTVGWFTSVYPVILEVSHKDDLARQIKEIKETLHRIPNKGIGWGILKYLTAREHKGDTNFNLQPRVSFNYLGQVEAGTGQRFPFEIMEDSPGHMQSPNGQRQYLLDISGIVFDNRLTLSVTYNKKQFKTRTIEGLRDHFQSELGRVITFCSSREQGEATPSDFGYKKLSLEELDTIFD